MLFLSNQLFKTQKYSFWNNRKAVNPVTGEYLAFVSLAARDGSVGQLVQYLKYLTIGWIAVKCCLWSPDDDSGFGDPLTFPLVASGLDNYQMDHHGICWQYLGSLEDKL